ncbi:MAG: 4-hydroxy-3-methylbut-2-enyl diphosphate reductase [Bacteroidales bacterium]|nr:4-hydroxy-3-methylbut-2-enyl diphosphate reductase [Bacteroidales bacterium]
MIVEIDGNAGFCGGVIRAIETAERYLGDAGDGLLYSLGDIVHNEEELQRLSSRGLHSKSLEELVSMDDPAGNTVLVRAHGIAPSVREELEKKGFNVIDCTCPVVLSIQKHIRNAGSKVLIFGKHGHPEVLGLVGQTTDAEVFDSLGQLKEILDGLSVDKGVEVFSQTTMNPDEYVEACRIISEKLPNAVIHDTICRQVASRHHDLSKFAASHDVVIFVAGSHSSNGKVLGSLCASVNPDTHVVGGPDDIRHSWFRSAETVGISGATSTPRWLLEEVARKVENLQ